MGALDNLPGEPAPVTQKPPKGTAAAARAKRRTAQARLEREENAKVKARSEGRCEVFVVGKRGWKVQVIEYLETGRRPDGRCPLRATQVHHMISGRGRRGVGLSLFAEAKQHVCSSCHQDITGDVGGKRLIRVGAAVPHYTDCYRRVR